MSKESNFNTLDMQTSDKSAPDESQSEKITLLGEIGKGWHWVVFIWKMTGSFGGISSLLSSIKRTIVMLIKRLLIQFQAK